MCQWCVCMVTSHLKARHGGSASDGAEGEKQRGAVIQSNLEVADDNRVTLPTCAAMLNVEQKCSNADMPPWQ